ncbi:MAG: OmpH family outer membrane protein [Pirellulaceae bacterium]|nr:OmpH family outer membrane protein [Pirellulaceae bacterium]
MKRLAFQLLALTCMSFVGLSQANAQGDSGIVAVLDVAKVFKENLDFSNQMEAIRQEADRMRNQLQAAQEDFRRQATEISQLPVGTPERKQAEAAFAQRQATFQTQARQDETDLLVKEAKAYYTTYQKLQNVVGQIAQQNNISLVLRFDSTEINPTNPNEVVAGVNRAIVYHYKLDLTAMVIQNMGPTVAATPTGTQQR